MKKILLVLPVLALCLGCNKAGKTYDGTGPTTAGGTAGGAITEREDGGLALVLNANGVACSAVYPAPAEGVTSVVQALSCSGGQGGTATMAYTEGGAPVSVTYSAGGLGAGSITF